MGVFCRENIREAQRAPIADLISKVVPIRRIILVISFMGNYPGGKK
jgi:hypothetical protein